MLQTRTQRGTKIETKDLAKLFDPKLVVGAVKLFQML